ncbi:MAG TPA: hypothetical protein VNA89_10880 [Gemmatimonadaceae bacterium]|nr:hypothetical protein [Gemmatimonadaceae bacterium]
MSRVLLAVAIVVAGCGSPAPKPEAPAPLPNLPLGGLAGQPVLVLPTHYLRQGDSLGWAARVERPREYLRTLDDEIAFAFRERGFGTTWRYPEELARTAKRNPGFAADPYALAAERLRPGAAGAEGQLREPLASQVRGLIAMTEARYALLPVELRFEREPRTDGGRAVLRVALIDGRRALVRWAGDVRSDPAPQLSPALVAGLATRLADLIATP